MTLPVYQFNEEEMGLYTTLYIILCLQAHINKRKTVYYIINTRICQISNSIIWQPSTSRRKSVQVKPGTCSDVVKCSTHAWLFIWQLIMRSIFLFSSACLTRFPVSVCMKGGDGNFMDRGVLGINISRPYRTWYLGCGNMEGGRIV